MCRFNMRISKGDYMGDDGNMSKINAKRLLDELEPDKDRAAVSLYLSQGLYKRFKKVCGKVSTSRVIEKLMKQFLDSIDGNDNTKS